MPRDVSDDQSKQETTERYEDLPLEEQVAALKKDLEAAGRDVSQNLDLAQRSQAELANYRRRSDDDRISYQKYSASRLLTKLLPIVNELDMAITHAGEHNTNAPWMEGVRLIQRKLYNLLDSEGVTKIEGVGGMFNPSEHEAIEMEETSKSPPGYVTRVLRTGYRLHDRVIQPAQVVVARELRKGN